MNYAKALRIVRAARGTSQQELAQNAGLSKSLLSKIESGLRDLSKDTKEKLVASLGIPASLLDILALEPHEARISKTKLELLAKELIAIQEEINFNEEKIQK